MRSGECFDVGDTLAAGEDSGASDERGGPPSYKSSASMAGVSRRVRTCRELRPRQFVMGVSTMAARALQLALLLVALNAAYNIRCVLRYLLLLPRHP